MSEGQLEWRHWHDLWMPRHPQTRKHPLAPGCGADCDGQLEWGILRLLGKADDVMTVNEIIDAFSQQGKAVSSVAVRETVRHLLMEHLMPIASSAGGGFWIARNPADLRKSRAELLSRIREIEARVAALEEVISVCEHRDSGPIIRRYKDQVPEMSLGIDRAGRRRKKSRVRDLIQQNVERKPATTDALEAIISEYIQEAEGK